jgi:hypothetical protein
MKTNALIILSICMFICASCKEKPAVSESKTQMQSITKQINYFVTIKDTSDESSIYNNLVIKERESFLKNVFDCVLSGKVTAYETNDFDRKISADEIKKSNICSDTIVMACKKNPQKDSTVINSMNNLDYKNVEKLVFCEEWLMDPATLKMEKRIKGYAPLMTIYIADPQTGEKIEKGVKALFWIKVE